jgi:hypothetical protein
LGQKVFHRRVFGRELRRRLLIDAFILVGNTYTSSIGTCFQLFTVDKSQEGL